MPLLIFDDFGLKLLAATQQEDLYELISECYERHRLVHRAVKLVIEGRSYRIKNFAQRAKSWAQGRTPRDHRCPPDAWK